MLNATYNKATETEGRVRGSVVVIVAAVVSLIGGTGTWAAGLWNLPWM